MSAPKVKTQTLTVYPAYVNWNEFDADEIKQIDTAVLLLKDYTLNRKIRPEVSFINNMFLDEFEGFEDTTPEMAVAITEKLTTLWEEENGRDSTKRTHEDKCADSLLMTFPPNPEPDLVEKVKLVAEKLARYMGKTDTGDYTLLPECPEKAYELLFKINEYKSEAIGKSMYESISEDAKSIEEKVNDILLSYIFTFKNQQFFEQEKDYVADALENKDARGTIAYSAKIALEKLFKESGIEQSNVVIYPMDFVPGYPVGATVTASWIEDSEFKTKTAYGHFKNFVS